MVFQTLLPVDWLEPLRDHTTVMATLVISSWNLKPINPLTTDDEYTPHRNFGRMLGGRLTERLWG